jgi:hypothetical protein
MPPSTQLPIGISDAIPKRAWKKKKVYGLADVVGLATAVIAQNDLAVKERLLPRSSQHKSKSRKWRYAIRLSARPRARNDLTHISDSESEVDTNLASFTAPPRLDGPSKHEED